MLREPGAVLEAIVLRSNQVVFERGQRVEVVHLDRVLDVRVHLVVPLLRDARVWERGIPVHEHKHLSTPALPLRR